MGTFICASIKISKWLFFTESVFVLVHHWVNQHPINNKIWYIFKKVKNKITFLHDAEKLVINILGFFLYPRKRIMLYTEIMTWKVDLRIFSLITLKWKMTSYQLFSSMFQYKK